MCPQVLVLELSKDQTLQQQQRLRAAHNLKQSTAKLLSDGCSGQRPPILTKQSKRPHRTANSHSPTLILSLCSSLTPKLLAEPLYTHHRQATTPYMRIGFDRKGRDGANMRVCGVRHSVRAGNVRACPAVGVAVKRRPTRYLCAQALDGIRELPSLSCLNRDFDQFL